MACPMNTVRMKKSGERKAAIGAAIFYLSAVSLSSIPVFLGLVSWLFIPIVTVADVGFVGSSLWLLKNPTRHEARRIKNIVLLWFLIGLLAFVVSVPLQ